MSKFKLYLDQFFNLLAVPLYFILCLIIEVKRALYRTLDDTVIAYKDNQREFNKRKRYLGSK